MPNLIVLCAGAHGRVVIDILQRAGSIVTAVTDADTKRHGTDLYGVKIIGDEDKVLGFDPSSTQLINALGNASLKIGNAGLAPRRALFTRFKDKGFSFAQVISSAAHISGHVTLGEGCHILTGAIIHPGSTIGANVIINTGAQLDHDNRIGPHSHIAPGAVLCGDVTVGEGCHIGAGAVIVQGVTIGDGAVVGAGAVVVANVPPAVTVLGNPAAVVRP